MGLKNSVICRCHIFTYMNTVISDLFVIFDFLGLCLRVRLERNFLQKFKVCIYINNYNIAISHKFAVYNIIFLLLLVGY